MKCWVKTPSLFFHFEITVRSIMRCPFILFSGLWCSLQVYLVSTSCKAHESLSCLFKDYLKDLQSFAVFSYSDWLSIYSAQGYYILLQKYILLKSLSAHWSTRGVVPSNIKPPIMSLYFASKKPVSLFQRSWSIVLQTFWSFYLTMIFENFLKQLNIWPHSNIKNPPNSRISAVSAHDRQLIKETI